MSGCRGAILIGAGHTGVMPLLAPATYLSRVGETANRMNKNRVLSHLLVLGSGRIATMTISVLGTIVSTRYLGPARVGELAFAGAIMGLLGQVNAMGMETFLIRAIARAPERSDTLVSTALVVRVALAIPMPLILTVYIHFAQLSPEVTTIAYLFCSATILWSFNAVFVTMLQGLERMSLVAGSDIFIKGIGLIATIVIVAMNGGVIALAVMAPVSNILLFIVVLHCTRPFVRLSLRITWEDIREVAMGSLSFWAKDGTMTLYGYIDSVILGSMAGVRSVGFYNPPTRVFAFVLAVPHIVGNATLPLLSRLGVEMEHDFARVGRKTLELLILVGVPLVVGLATFAGPIIALLFGRAFDPAVPVLKVLSLSLVPMFLNSQFAFILSGRDQQWRWTRIMMVCGGVNVGANLILIPLAVHFWSNGALGAAVAMLCTELLMVAYGCVVLRDIVMAPSLARTAAGALAGGAAQAGLVLLIGSQLLLLVAGEAVGVGVYAGIVLALGAVPRSDVTVLWQAALRRVPGVA